MKKMIKFPSIEQFRSTVSSINRQYNYVGLDPNGDAIYDHTLPKPKLHFKGTVKIHGTNAAVCYNSIAGLWAQSRENIITSQKDNAGFAFFVEIHEKEIKDLILQVVNKEDLNIAENTVTIYGEWAGGNIQKGVAICNIPKSFFIFGVKITPHTTTEEELKENPAYWVDYNYLRNNAARIFNIDDFGTYAINVDFKYPELAQNILSALTIKVEEECPVAKAFGFSGVGEGIVWSTEVNGVVHRFKVKGEKHAASKVKTLAPVDVEKIASIQEFVDYAVTRNRVEQATQNVFPNNEPLDIKKFGEVIRWVLNDVLKEETDTLAKNNLEPKEINKYLAAKTKEIFLTLL